MELGATKKLINGVQCQSARAIRTHAGMVPRGTFGTVLADVENIDRRMLLVQWENKICAYAFPQEVEMVAE